MNTSSETSANIIQECENNDDSELDMEDFWESNDDINSYLKRIYEDSVEIRKKDGNYFEGDDDKNISATAALNTLYCTNIKKNIF